MDRARGLARGRLPAAGARRAPYAALLLLLASAALLAACAAARPTQEAGRNPEFALVAEALAQPQPGTISVAGYLLADADGERLVGRLSAGPEGLRPVGSAQDQIWIERGEGAPAADGLRSGSGGSTLVIARGGLEGPGSFGPGGAYRFRMRAPEVQALTPREASVETLVKRPQDYDRQAVRVNGALLARPGAAVLASRLGPGGVPEAASLQLKLAGVIDEAMLPASLERTPSGDVRFGLVQVEGVWRDGSLTVLAILPVTSATPGEG